MKERERERGGAGGERKGERKETKDKGMREERDEGMREEKKGRREEEKMQTIKILKTSQNLKKFSSLSPSLTCDIACIKLHHSISKSVRVSSQIRDHS